MDTNTIIKGLVKEFDMEGTKEFLKNFNIATKRVDQMSMFIGKYKNFTFMCNGQALMGYMKRPEDTTIQFTFRNLNELPWTNVYDKDLKIFIKKVVDQFFIPNQRLMARYQLIMEAAKDYDAIVIRALSAKVVRMQELRKPTQLLIAKKLNTNEVACDSDELPNPSNNTQEEIKQERKEDVKMNVMQLAHKIRKEEKLEGDYHAQMKYALKKAHAILKGQDNKVEESTKQHNDNAEDLIDESGAMNDNVSDIEQEIAADDSISIKEDLTVQEVLQKYKGKYDAYVYFEGYNIHLNIKGKTQVLPTKFKGLRLEREFIAKLSIFNQLNRTLIIHHYDVFDPQEKIDFVRIPC